MSLRLGCGAALLEKISGPLLDRIDLPVPVPVPVVAMAPESMAAQADGEPSVAIAGRVVRAHARQLARQGTTNQRLSTREIDRHCELIASAELLLRGAMRHLHWSARAYYRVLKVARTIVDLAWIGDGRMTLTGFETDAVRRRSVALSWYVEFVAPG